MCVCVCIKSTPLHYTYLNVTEQIWLTHCHYKSQPLCLMTCRLNYFPYLCQNTITCISISCVITMYMPATNMPLNYHISAIHVNSSQISDNNISIYAHMNSLQLRMLPGTLVYIHCTLLAYTPELTCLPHCTYMSQCTSTLVYIQKQQQTATLIYHTIAICVPTTNMPLKYQI